METASVLRNFRVSLGKLKIAYVAVGGVGLAGKSCLTPMTPWTLVTP